MARARRTPARPPPARRRPKVDAATAWEALSLSAGDAVIVYLQVPKEKVWGLLVSLGTAGIVVRCIDLAAFDDWMRQEARRDEPYLGLSTVFYPMNRVERMERDQTMGPVISLLRPLRPRGGAQRARRSSGSRTRS